MPIINKNQTVGAIIGAVPAHNMKEIIFDLSINNAGYGFLSDSDGNILMHPYLDEIEYTNIFELVNEGVIECGTNDCYFKYIDENGIDRYIFYTAVLDTGWLVGIDVPASAVYYISNSIINKLAVASFISFILLVVLVYYSTIKLFKPMDNLISEMKKAEKGDLSVQTNIVRKDEISEIAIQFNKTIADIYARDEELRALNEELDANCIELRDSNNEVNKTNEKLMLAYEEITKNLQGAKFVNKLGEKLFSVIDLDILLSDVLSYTHEMINSAKSAIYLFDSEISRFTIRESINYSKGEVKKLELRRQEGTFAWLDENKCELYSENIYDDDRFIPKTLSRKGKMCYELPILSEKSELIGVMSYISDNLDMTHINYFKQLAKMISVEITNKELSDRIEETYMEVLIALIKGLELKDKYTKGHSERVMEYSIMIGKKIGISVHDMKNLQYGSMLHDIGKIGIPDEILLKNGSLTKQEYELIKAHPANGESFMSSLKFLEDTLPIIKNHHERIDGKGYPDNLVRDNIPISARIVAIADAYDAMTSERPYRHALTKEKAIEELISNSGTQFDSYLVQKFIKCISL
ncbi:MAG: HD domain-containing protein [Clostridiales bacterium]|nr:HD domain-containing protein [Clostridiales bacterium]